MMVYLVDDEPDLLESLSWMLAAEGIDSQSFSDGASLLAALPPQAVGVAVLDINMPQLDGLELQQQLRQLHPSLGLIFLTGYGSVPKAVQALQAGALDFLEKPVAPARLLTAIAAAQQWAQTHAQQHLQQQALQQKLALLTEREAQLLPLVVAGKANKVICAELHLAQRTVEIHRRNLFAKMAVANAAELALLLGSQRS
ncbi:response regulator transcription factor [Ferrimonas senticii]|uniref:response regulator transcription factor n=1 Tax=Ferrimonas senticii TaxID=394566 RepID=UPI000418394C|nr:response regulator [Ferrimonas senticii]